MKTLLLLLTLALTACQSTPVSHRATATDRNTLGRQVVDRGASLELRKAPALVFTGATATAQEIRAWLHANGISAQTNFADGQYAQIEATSALAVAHWLKRVNWDIGYTYVGGTRDCDNFARQFRVLPDFFNGAPSSSQAAVFGIYAKMKTPFAGVSDGYHALNVVWTDAGVYVFEPQGVHLTYQLLSDWNNKGGITHGIAD